MNGTALMVVAIGAVMGGAIGARRAPRGRLIGAGLGAAGGVAVLVAIALLSERYQPFEFRADLRHCLDFERGEGASMDVTNTCAEPVVVGLCLTADHNPAPCSRQVTLAAGETKAMDRTGVRFASRPGNAKGATITACRPGDRPSRDVDSGGMLMTGICLPPA